MKKETQHSIIQRIIVCAILAALGFVLDRFLGITFPLFGVKSFSVNLSFVPIIFSGFIYGPVWGALVGALQDLLGAFLVPMGPFFIGYTATTAFVGACAGFFGMIFLKNKDDLPSPRPSLSNGFTFSLPVFCLLITAISSLLNSLWLNIQYLPQKTYFAVALPRLLGSLVVPFPLYTILLWILVTRVTPKIKNYLY